MSNLYINPTCTICAVFALFSLCLVYWQQAEVREQEMKDELNIMKNFREKDAALVDEILQLDSSVKNMSEPEAMEKFYKFLAFPHQGVCKVLKRIGGKWLTAHSAIQVDGDKFICLDSIIMKAPCLIYTFGIADDWTFEDLMDDMGCTVFAHDHTVTFPEKRGKDTHFVKLGLGDQKDMDTLGNIMEKNGHGNTTIEYLKIDIEGHELTGLPQWLASSALDNVNQLALELHMGELHTGPRFLWLLGVLQDLYKLNFRVISQEVNMVIGPHTDRYYNLVEVVFMKDSIWN